jgi:hypothetical protein
MAAFWEYARESQPLIQIVQSGYLSWKQTHGDENARRSWEDHLLRRSRVRDFLLLVTAYPFFPYLSFSRVIEHPLFSRFYTALGFGSSHVYCFPLELAQQFRSRAELEGYALYCIAIPWTRTNPELAKMFERGLQALRPAAVPPPTAHPGRRGRCLSGSPLDMLNQLAAFRLGRKGVTFSEAMKFAPIGVSIRSYQSSEGWDKAARAAKRRIEKMLEEPFFPRAGKAEEEINSA